MIPNELHEQADRSASIFAGVLAALAGLPTLIFTLWFFWTAINIGKLFNPLVIGILLTGVYT